MSQKQTLIDKKFSQVCERLKDFDKQLNDKFINLKTNFDRFKFIWCINFLHQELDTLFQENTFDSKDDTKAKEFRNQGNESYKEKKFYEALLKYNLSIQHASHPTGSTNHENNELALAYANRSAVFFHVNEFELSLNDIDTSFKFEYPTHLKQKLIERKVNCLFQLGRFNDIRKYLKSEQSIDRKWVSEFLEKLKEFEENEEEKASDHKNKRLFKNYGNISFEIKNKNNRIENASNAITIDFSFDQGFYLKAVKDIEVGDIIVDETPYASVLLGEHIDTHCSECMVLLNILKMNITHCRQCSKVTYCSKKCEKKAWKTHHQYECKYFNLLAQKSGITHMEWLALRIVLKAGLDYLKSMKQFLYSHETRYENFKRDEESMKIIKEINEHYDSNSYLTIFNLITNSGLRTTSDLFRRAFVSLFFVKLLKKTSYFGTEINPEDECLIGGLILRHLQSISCNAHEVCRLRLGFDMKKSMESSEPIALGSGIYSILSLFNHSCDPSVTRYFRGNSCQVRAIKKIKKDEEIFDNYGLVYAVNDLTDRQEKLLEQYFFQCTCIACMNDWPLYGQLESDLNMVRKSIKCDDCKKTNKNDSECNDCIKEFDNLLLEQLNAKTNLKAMLKFNLSTDIEDDNVRKRIEDMYESFSKYLNLLEQKGIKRPFQDYNSYQEALKQCINFINRY